MLGWPVAHSLSPLIHSLAISRQGLDAVYLALPVEPSVLGAALEGLDSIGARGLNVTAPHKQEVMAHLAGLTDLAAGLGSVNCIFRGPDGSLHGDNTDMEGILAAISANPKAGPLEGTAVVLGAGGASASAVGAVSRLGARHVAVMGRRQDRVKALLDRLESSGLCRTTTLEAVPLDAREPVLRSASAIVQATSAPPDGPPPIDPCSLPESSLVVDMIYGPGRDGGTRFLDLARRRGMTTVDGLSILAWQAAFSWERWVGEELDKAAVEAMLDAARNHQK